MLEDKGHRKNTPTCIFHGRNYFTNSVVIWPLNKLKLSEQGSLQISWK